MTPDQREAIERAARAIANRIEAERVSAYSGADCKGFASVITAELSPLFERLEGRARELEGVIVRIHTAVWQRELGRDARVLNDVLN